MANDWKSVPKMNEGWERRRCSGEIGTWEAQYEMPMLVNLTYEGECSHGAIVFRNTNHGCTGVRFAETDEAQPSTILSKEFYFVWQHDVELIQALMDYAVGKDGWIIESKIDGEYSGLSIDVGERTFEAVYLIGGVYTGDLEQRETLKKVYDQSAVRKVLYDSLCVSPKQDRAETQNDKEELEITIFAESYESLPMKHFLVQKADGKWELNEEPLTVLPARVNLQCVGKILENKAWLFRNQIDPAQGDIYHRQPFREYYFVWCSNTDFFQHIPLNTDIWLLEGWFPLKGGFYGELLDVERTDTHESIHVAEIAAINDGGEKEYPLEYEWYLQFLKDEFKSKICVYLDSE